MSKTYKVTYTQEVGGEGQIIVKAQDKRQAINNAKYLCFTGSDFRDPIKTDEEYIKPRKQGFQGSERM